MCRDGKKSTDGPGFLPNCTRGLHSLLVSEAVDKVISIGPKGPTNESLWGRWNSFEDVDNRKRLHIARFASHHLALVLSGALRIPRRLKPKGQVGMGGNFHSTAPPNHPQLKGFAVINTALLVVGELGSKTGWQRHSSNNPQALSHLLAATVAIAN